MKNILILFLSLMISVNLLAEDLYTLCMTSVAPTTSFVTETEGDQVKLSVYHHNGVEYAPFWNSVVVPQDLKILEGKSELVKKLGAFVQVKWPKDKCVWAGEDQFSCMGGATQTEGGLSVEPWAFYSNVITEKSFAGEYKWIELTMSYYTKDQNGQRQSEQGQIVMKYEAADCQLSNHPILKVQKSLFKK